MAFRQILMSLTCHYFWYSFVRMVEREWVHLLKCETFLWKCQRHFTENIEFLWDVLHGLWLTSCFWLIFFFIPNTISRLCSVFTSSHLFLVLADTKEGVHSSSPQVFLWKINLKDNSDLLLTTKYSVYTKACVTQIFIEKYWMENFQKPSDFIIM